MFMENSETRIKVKGVAFNKIIKIIVSPLMDYKKEIFDIFDSIFEKTTLN